ncbi:MULTISPECIES: hypothetical protein [unclassified Yoonia]|uniref:hypothetical protein n=1 Tax=unclassified Yoonia TaxID=2629118 RepID=UPI002AFE1CC7|nr:MULTISPECIES: hypothetical protein [unclassified Yoonia]
MFFIPFAGLVVVAGIIGYRMGQMPSETEIIARYAATYVAMAGDGAALTDCVATTHPDPAVRLVINCAHPDGLTTTFYAGPRGEAMPQPQGPAT